ncbi:hypothetical protein SynA1544_01304 [Synechococcus sp. A15-44]|nr:hypothetical protein SynA1544_01304 [Synechococcus sp. A15-44]
MVSTIKCACPADSPRDSSATAPFRLKTTDKPSTPFCRTLFKEEPLFKTSFDSFPFISHLVSHH